ncbi:2-C-methyl-D-erythritol 2,4-cyclodiphosphate synthase [bacterium]|nr:2-C-methyl-D-erythritol 2,4-cyclodiphosphate synthase [bacterium]
MRIGYGYDVHKLVPNRKLILGGVEIAHELGLDGHSDADVLLHAITDALLGALALGDIGTHFPDTDPKYKNVDSRILLRDAYKLIQSKGYVLGNLDATVVAQEPKLKPYISEIRELISSDLNTAIENISIKATTSEWLGFEGRKEGISSSAVVLLSMAD